MAQQLKAAGQEVGILALLKTWAHPPHLTFYKYFVHRFMALLGLGPLAIGRHLKKKMLRVFGKKGLPGNPEAEEFAFTATQQGLFKNREIVYGTNLAATRKYKSKPYAGIVTLFNGTYYQTQDIIPPQSGFMTLAEGVEIHLIPGSHRSVIKEPNVQLLAEKLKSCLDLAQAEETRKRN